MSLEVYHNIVEVSDHGNKLTKFISAAEAYRKYNWLKKVPITNSVGNFRGMVINAKAKSVYSFTSKSGKALEGIQIVLSWAEECKRASSSFERIFMSTDTHLIKAAKFSAQISGIAMRVLLETTTGTIKFGLKSTTFIAKAFGDKAVQHNAELMESKLNYMTSSFNDFTTGDGFYNLIQVDLN